MNNSPLKNLKVRQNEKRDQILEIASHVFSVRDYHLVKVDEISQKAGVGKGTIYRYFPSKEDLYLAIIEKGHNSLIQKMEQEFEKEIPALKKLEGMIDCLVSHFCHHIHYFKILSREQSKLLLRKKQLFKSKRERIAELISQVIRKGIDENVFRDMDEYLTASMLIGIIWGTVLNHSEALKSHELSKKICDLYLHGIVSKDLSPKR